MNKTFTFLVILGFLGAAVFSFLPLPAGSGHVVCLASSAQTSPCPREIGGIDFVNFHLNAFKSFSQATTAQSLLAFLGAALAALAGIYVLNKEPAALISATDGAWREDKNFANEKIKLRRWLALFEKRDPRSVLRAA